MRLMIRWQSSSTTNNEEVANRELLDVELIAKWKTQRLIEETVLRQIYLVNGGGGESAPDDYESLFDDMVAKQLFKVAIVIGGQGPEAFGMPEMFTPMQHINANHMLQKMSVLLSDGRYSGVTYGAAIGHVTPESIRGGGLLYLRTGDVVHLGFRRKRIDVLDVASLQEGRITPATEDWKADRAELGLARRQRLVARRRQVAAGNRLIGCTDAAHGVVPDSVWEEADFLTADEAMREVETTCV